MITRAQIEKLGALHAVEPTMLSLYLAGSPSANLTVRAGELIAAAGAACGQPLAARDRDRAPVTAPGTRWPLPEGGVLGVRPHIRPGRWPGPGYECGRCGTLSLDADTCCPDWGTAALPVPDLIEEMVSRVLEDGGDVLVAGGGSSRDAAPGSVRK